VTVVARRNIVERQIVFYGLALPDKTISRLAIAGGLFRAVIPLLSS